MRDNAREDENQYQELPHDKFAPLPLQCAGHSPFPSKGGVRGRAEAIPAKDQVVQATEQPVCEHTDRSLFRRSAAA